MAGLEGQKLGEFEVVRKLGEGGMGLVYLARQPSLGRDVAIKTLWPSLAANEKFVERFHREANAAARLNHPNIIQVYTAGERAGLHYIAMEYVYGKSLREKIDRHGRLEPEESVAICVHIVQALKYSWERAQIIHRDIKPENILISNQGDVKVADLGLAKQLGDAATGATMSGVVMGSPHYISPEQAHSAKDADFRSDIYSLGCTLFHMLAGRPPYEGNEPLPVMLKHINDPLPNILDVVPSCPAPIVALLKKMLAKDRTKRYQSYDELLADLIAAHDRIAAAAFAPTKSRDMTLVYAGLASVAIVAVIGLFIWSPWKKGGVVAPVPGRTGVELSGTIPQPPGTTETTPVSDAFIAEVAALPAEEQVKRVAARLKELNPGYDGKVSYKIASNSVVEVDIQTAVVSNISPLRAFINLQKLHCWAGGMQSAPTDGALTDLSPLRGLRLVELKFPGNPIQDLTPLEGMPLEVLWCWKSKVNDLSALRGMPLVEIGLDGTDVTDLSPLRGMPLRVVFVRAPKLKDFSPLAEIKTLEKINGLPAAEFWKQVDAGNRASTPATGTWKVYSGWPFAAAEAKRRQEETAKALGVPVERDIDVGSGVRLRVVLVPAGEFMMGSDQGDEREKPVHKVTIGKPFRIGKYEVTQEFWQAVTGNNPSRSVKSPKNPVDMVSWNDCQDFVAKLRAKVPGVQFSLPTEAQWEYACRAGSAGDYCYGNGEANIGDYAWHSGNSKSQSHPVGEKKPNQWGLYDMHGNSSEWCQDFSSWTYDGVPTDGSAWMPTGNPKHIVRSGAWYFPAALSRSAARSSAWSDNRYNVFSLRLAIALGTP